jgi:abortive infection bacteriophage resistance protein
LSEVKAFRSTSQQVALLEARGMDVGDHDAAVELLRRVSYYRLSGYWYSFRRLRSGHRSDDFAAGTRLADVVSLYDFDARLRTTVFDAIAPIELAVRAALGHELGRLDPCAHLEPALLGVLARSGDQYADWRRRHDREVRRSREDFVEHHRLTYGGTLPVWAAVELMDWGSLSRLFGFAPPIVQTEVAGAFGLRPPQFSSWLRALNVVRNACAHHGRLFNRVYPKRPRLPLGGTHDGLDLAAHAMNRTYGQLTLVQYLRQASGIGPSRLLVGAMAAYPPIALVPFEQTGAPADWNATSLWR